MPGKALGDEQDLKGIGDPFGNTHRALTTFLVTLEG
jgi:hypothetical protein